MSNKKQKDQKQRGRQPTPQPTTPATPLELSDEELGQVTGGALDACQPAATSLGGLPSLLTN